MSKEQVTYPDPNPESEMSNRKSSSPATVRMSKEQLRQALIGARVQVPPANAKKEEFQKLYDQKVLPQHSRSEFSSDDEQEQDSLNGVETAELRPKSKAELVEEINGMSDGDLYTTLRSLGVNVGPVVDSTRSLYKKQLVNLLYNEVVVMKLPDAVNGLHGESPNGNNGYSDSDEDVLVEKVSRSNRTSRTSSSGTARRSTRSNRSTPTSDHTFAQADGNRTPVREGGSSTPSLSDVESLDSRSTRDFSDYNFSESSRLHHAGTGEERTSTTSGGISYFKERPGYSSTTTSSQLPRKPVAKQGGSDELKKRNAEINENAGIINMMIFIAIALGFVAAIVYASVTRGESGSQEQVADELDALLSSMDQEN